MLFGDGDEFFLQLVKASERVLSGDFILRPRIGGVVRMSSEDVGGAVAEERRPF